MSQSHAMTGNVASIFLHDNKQQQRRPTPGSEDSNRFTYMQGSVVLGDHTVGSVPTDICEDQEMDVILFWFRSHTDAPCRQIRKKGEARVAAFCNKDLGNI